MSAEVRAKDADIPMGMTQIEDGDAKVLFFRDDTGLRAFQAQCPHAGAPLADGEICGGRILYCPWHKAAFDLGDGTLLQPPALAGLDQYPIRKEGESVVATLEPLAKAKPSERDDSRTFVIVGSGAAAATAAITLREEGFGGRILMVAREAGAPYDRTMLSKDFLAEKMDASDVALQPDFADTYRVDIVVGAASRIDPSRRSLTLPDGTEFVADALLIATGSNPIKPKISGEELKNIFFLRSLADATALSDAAEPGKSIAIVGGGFIALEAAAFLTQRGLAATIVSMEPLPLASRFGDDIAHALKTNLEGMGVRFVEGKVARFEGQGAVQALRLEGGETIDTNLVLVAAGAAPATDAIAQTPKEADGSIAVDDHLCIASGVWAAGDIVTFPLHDGRHARIEHWRLAQQHGRHAARGMLGSKAPFADAPFFWSRQGELSLGYAGYAHEWDKIVTEGEPAKLDFISYYVRNGHTVAACSIGRDADLIRFLHRQQQGEISGPP